MVGVGVFPGVGAGVLPVVGAGGVVGVEWLPDDDGSTLAGEEGVALVFVEELFVLVGRMWIAGGCVIEVANRETASANKPVNKSRTTTSILSETTCKFFQKWGVRRLTAGTFATVGANTMGRLLLAASGAGSYPN